MIITTPMPLELQGAYAIIPPLKAKGAPHE